MYGYKESSNIVGSASDTILSNEALRDGLFSGDHHEERQAEKTSPALKLRRLALAFGLFKVKTEIAYCNTVEKEEGLPSSSWQLQSLTQFPL